MDFRGLAVGAGNVARGYRAAETELRAAEVQRLNLQHLRQEQAERDRQEAERRALLEKPPELPGGRVPLGGVPRQPIPGMQLPERAQLPVRDVTPPPTTAPVERPAAPAVPEAAPPEIYVGSATAPLTPLAPEGTPVDPARLARAQDVYRINAMRVRDAMVGLEALRARGASSDRIVQQEAVVRREQEQLEAAAQGIRRIVPSAVTAPVSRPAVPAASETARRAQEYDAKQTFYDELIRQSAVQAGIDPVAFKRLLGTESSFNPNAVSPLGPQFGLGIAQIAAVHGLSDADRLNPEKAIPFAAQLFSKYLREAGGDYERALLRYKGASSVPGRQAMAAPVATITAGLTATPAAAAAAEAAPAEPAPGPVAQVLQPTAGVTTPEEDILPSQVYAVDPSRITFDQRFLNQSYEQQRQITTDAAVSTLTNLDMTYNAERETLVAQYNAQIQAGRSPAAMATRSQIIALDAKYREARTLAETGARSELLEQDRKYELGRLSLASVAAAAQLEYQREPAGAAQLLSYIFQQPMKLQMRSDGNIDMLLPQRDGAFAVRGTFSQAQVIDMLRSAADQVYREAKAATQREVAVKVTEQQAQMIRELAKARVETQGSLQEITLRGQQFTGQADGNGGVILYTPDGSRAGRLVERETTVDGLPVSTFVLQPIQMPPR
jgi:soluble lytic murein transglycosylase-like protein